MIKSRELGVVLVQLYGALQPANAEPLAIEVLAGQLKEDLPECSIELTVVDEKDDSSIERLMNLVRSGCQLLGLSVPQGTYGVAIKVLETVYKQNGRPKVVLGHALPSYTPELFLAHFPELLIVRGWGEDSLVKIGRWMLGDDVDPGSIENLAYLRNKELVLNEVKWPRRYSKPLRLDIEKYFTRVESSRGCSYGRCSFCTRPPSCDLHSNQWLRFPPDAVLETIRELYERGVRTFTFADEDFIGTDLEGALVIATQLRRFSDLRFSLSLRIGNLCNLTETIAHKRKTNELLRRLVDAGLSLVFLGVESCSASQLKRYGKRTTVDQNIKAVNMLLSYGIDVELGFMLFDPLTSIEELEENISILRETGFWVYLGRVCNRLRVQKDTALERLIKKTGLVCAYDFDRMEYKYRFKAPLVTKVTDTCFRCTDGVNKVYIAARNKRRSISGTPEKDIVREVRDLDFHLLQSVLACVREKGTGSDLESIAAEYARQFEAMASLQPTEERNVIR